MNICGISLSNGYLQTWGLSSRLNRLWKPLGTSLRWLCGKLTGHHPSKTEWGYGGGDKADVWCRWCNQIGQIPITDADKRFKNLRSTVWGIVGCDVRQQPWAGPDDLNAASRPEEPK